MRLNQLYENSISPRKLTLDDSDKRATYEEAAHISGYDIRVKDAPASFLGPRIAIWTHDERADLSPFWAMYKQLCDGAD